MDDIARVRRWTLVFVVGLGLSGLTAIPIRTEVEAAVRVLGEDLGSASLPDAMGRWLIALRDGIRLTSEHAPFLFYGTDWLAFGHLAIAAIFVGAWRDPLRNRWLYRYGMALCAAVPVWAFVFGPLRGVPFWWQLVDASFGVGGFVPLWLCDRWLARVEQDEGGRA